MDDQSLGRPGIAQVLLQSIEKERAARERREAKERREQIRQFFIEFQSVAFDKAATYIGLLFSAGYVGFFAIWGWVQPYLVRWETLTTALLLGFSLFVFILWQVYAMALIGRQQMLLANVISAPEADFDKVVEEHKQKETALRSRLSRMWPIVFRVSTIPGVAGGVLLLLACARHLFTGK